MNSTIQSDDSSRALDNNLRLKKNGNEKNTIFVFLKFTRGFWFFRRLTEVPIS